MAARKSAAQKAAEAAERDEYTARQTVLEDDNLTAVVDEKGKKLTVQQLKNKLRNEAEREVLDTHKDEVIKITAAKYKVHNLDYVRRLSEEEKAAKAIEEYYVKFPKLRPQIQQQQAQFEETIVVSPEQNDRIVVAEEGGALEQFREAATRYYPGDPILRSDEDEAREGE